MVVCFSQMLLKLIQTSIMILKSMNKIKWIKIGLTAAKYLITLLLGALGGAEYTSDAVSNLLK